MARYTTGRTFVDAYVITAIDVSTPQGTRLLLETGTTVTASALLLARYTPQPGDYWVMQQDGRLAIVAKHIFEKRHTLTD